MKKLLSCLFTVIIISTLFAQEALKSVEEEYYDFLSLQGKVERPTLGYRTLSDSVWNLEEGTEHIWQDNNLGHNNILWEPETKVENWFVNGLYQGFKYKIYGPEWYNSYNTAAPYGQNDGALWQGRGYNTSLTSGIRAEGYGFEITLKPQISFSQNIEYQYIKPNYGGDYFSDKAELYGYYGLVNIDAPQRFGNESIFNFDFGDSEIRYTISNFTMGYGTETIWLGPSKLNPIIHSNNASSYPKIDIGFRKSNLVIPFFEWYLGSIEFRGWWGKLSESDYFDNDDNNNNNLISGLSLNYSFPGFFDGLTIGFNRVLLAKWNEISPYSLFRIYVPRMNGDSDKSDQRFSLTFDYLLPKIGMDIYLEWARNDFSPNLDYIIRYPYHTEGWTFGINKSFDLSDNYKLLVLLELTYLECSADYDRLINWSSTFYAHHEITQGHTNRGQWLGAGIGTGGNSQYLGFQLLHKKGDIDFFVQRRNPDLDYTMYIDAHKDAENISQGHYNAEANIRCLLSFGLSSKYYLSKNIVISGSYIITDERNPLNISNSDHSSIHRINNTFNVLLKYYL